MKTFVMGAFLICGISFMSIENAQAQTAEKEKTTVTKNESKVDRGKVENRRGEYDFNKNKEGYRSREEKGDKFKRNYKSPRQGSKGNYYRGGKHRKNYQTYNNNTFRCPDCKQEWQQKNRPGRATPQPEKKEE